MKKYIVQKGWIEKGAYNSYENEQEFSSLPQAHKEFETTTYEGNEYVVLIEAKEDNWEVIREKSFLEDRILEEEKLTDVEEIY